MVLPGTEPGANQGVLSTTPLNPAIFQERRFISRECQSSGSSEGIYISFAATLVKMNSFGALTAPAPTQTDEFPNWAYEWAKRSIIGLQYQF